MENGALKRTCMVADPPEKDTLAKLTTELGNDKGACIDFSKKPDHVLLLYRNFQIGLCTDTEIVFSNVTFKCHRWIIDAYMDMNSKPQQYTTAEKFISEYLCCLKAPELPMVLRAYFRHSETQDLTVIIGDEEFKCHLDVLRCFSNFFNSTNRFETIRLSQNHVSIRAFFMIYKGWMLDQIPDLPMQGIDEVFKAAKYLQIDFLVNKLSVACNTIEKEAYKKRPCNSYYEPAKLTNKFIVEKFK